MAASGDSAAAHHDLAWAHARLLRDSNLQFHFDKFVPPHPPRWLEAVFAALFKAVVWMLPALKLVFWGGLVFIAGFILFAIWREIAGGRFSPNRKAAQLNLGAENWRPTAAEARVLLEDADRLASEGRFAEAVHTLLFRSIDDIRDRQPHLVKPALTARDIAALDALPSSARPAFGRIAQVVERSFFGGRPVGPDEFAACRQDYEAFALQGAWA